MLEMQYPKMLKMLFVDICFRVAGGGRLGEQKTLIHFSPPLQPGDRYTVYFMNVSDFPQGF